jgi:DNA polymerase V
MTTNLVVADASRTEKTICLAVSPSLKAYGIPGRARLFEVVQKVQQLNAQRQRRAPGHTLNGSSWNDIALRADPSLALDYIVAPPQMARYMDIGTKIYNIYLKYVAPTDIFAYSIDEVFIDVTDYLPGAGLTPREFAMKLVLDVLHTTGITATAGIGTNLYLCKIAMDIGAKRAKADKNGVRIAQLDEQSYRRTLWTHRPLTDFWRVGKGYAKKLEAHGMFTMGDVARCSLENEELLYKLFGVNAELLIDHAWGWEPCTMADVKAYKPESNSLSSGQVLQCPYSGDKTRLVVREMADMLALDLVDKGLVTDQLVLTVGYDIENLRDPAIRKRYHGPVTTDHYGRRIPKHAHGTINLPRYTASTRMIVEAAMELFDRITDPMLLSRRLNLTANHVVPEGTEPEAEPQQMSLFADHEALGQQYQEETEALERERSMQKTILNIKKKYGKNAILKGMDLEEGATTQSRNQQIGGHKA